MKRSRGLVLAFATVAVALTLLLPSAANALITWTPSASGRVLEYPRVWNNNADTVAGHNISGTEGMGDVAVSNNGTTNFIHAVIDSDGSGGPNDYNDIRSFKYPYFGANTAYGGNDSPMTNDGTYLATPYYDGDCGVMRPHQYGDDFGSYKGGWQPEVMTGATATISAGPTLNITASPNLAHLDGFAVGDRFQTGAFNSILGAATSAWIPSSFNRTVTGPDNTAGNINPMNNAPYWRVTATTWNTLTATPDVATAQPATATYAAGTGTFTGVPVANAMPAAGLWLGPRPGAVSMFQGTDVGERVLISGATPAAYNGTWQIATAPRNTPWIFTATPLQGQAPGGAMTAGTVTRQTDGFLTHSITAATAVGTTATFTTSVAHRLVVGMGVDIAGMTPAGYNGSWTVASVPTATTFTVTLGSSPTIGTVYGIATIRTASATQVGTLTRGSDCSRVYYTRSAYTVAANDGSFWDGGGGPTEVSPCAASATCGSTNPFSVAGGPTLGGTKTYLSEMSAGGSTIETYLNYVFVAFFSQPNDVQYMSDMCPNDPRIMYVRVNNNYGAWNAWSAPVRITPAAGQTNWPSMTVDKANGNIYIISTNAVSGNIELYKSTTFGASYTGPTIVDNNKYVMYSGFPPNDEAGSASYKGSGNDGGNGTNDPAPCITASRGLGTVGDDSRGFGYTQRIAAYNNNVGVAYIKNAAGDRIVAKISTDAGVTWTQSKCPFAQCSIDLAVAGGGAKCPGFGCSPGGPLTCPWPYGYDITPGPATGCANHIWSASHPQVGNVAIAAGDGGGGVTRIDFAWDQDGGWGPKNTVGPNGMYFKEWRSTGGWQTTRLVSCALGNVGGPASVGAITSSAPITGVATADQLIMGVWNGSNWTYTTTLGATAAVGDTVRFSGITPDTLNGTFTITARTATTITVNALTSGTTVGTAPGYQQAPTGSYTWVSGGTAGLVNAGTTNDPCIGKAATGVFTTFRSPELAMYGTTGVGLVWVACPNNTIIGHAPCSGDPSDPGSQILYKESGNSGAAWGAAWATPGSPYTVVASNATTIALPSLPATDVDTWRSSWEPSLVFDLPGDSATGCGQQVSGAPVVGCKRYVFYISYSSGANPNFQYATNAFVAEGVQS